MSDTFSDANGRVRLGGSLVADGTQDFENLHLTGDLVVDGDASAATLAVAGLVAGQAFDPAGLTGATAATRYVGGTLAAAPILGPYLVGDFVVTNTGKIFVCTVAGTPGTWVDVAAGAGGSAGAAIYADGSDGTVTFDGAATILGMVPVANVYTLTRDIYLAAATINNGVTISTGSGGGVGSYRIYCQGVLTNNGTISNDGGAGTAAGVGGVAPANGSVKGANSGSVGGTAAGTAGSAAANSYGGASGAGGGGLAGAGGALGAAPGPTAAGGSPRSFPASAGGNLSEGSFFFGGAGGGGGGGDGVNTGGGGGGGGGGMLLYVKTFAGAGAIHARGGGGGNGNASSTTGAGGGGGGGGGWIRIISGSVAAGAIAGQTIDTNGGSGGTKTGTAGVNGSVGSSGTAPILLAS